MITYIRYLTWFAFVNESSSGVESQKMGFQNLGTNYMCLSILLL